LLWLSGPIEPGSHKYCDIIWKTFAVAVEHSHGPIFIEMAVWNKDRASFVFPETDVPVIHAAVDEAEPDIPGMNMRFSVILYTELESDDALIFFDPYDELNAIRREPPAPGFTGYLTNLPGFYKHDRPCVSVSWFICRATTMSFAYPG
jgi:hypothetical protein